MIMNTKNPRYRWKNYLPSRFSFLAIGAAGLLLLSAASGWTADEPTVIDKTKEAVQDAGRATVENFETLWHRVDESRLKHRTRDEIVAWVIMGVLVGSVAGMMSSLKPSGLGQLGRLLLGLGGALIGGTVVHVARINFGWGPVKIRYEELLFSLLGAVALVVVGRFIRSRSKKKDPSA